MASLIAAAVSPSYPAKIVLVLSNREDAAGLDIARRQEIKAHAIPHGDYDSREAHDAAMSEALKAAKADIVYLAGYMRLLTPDFVKRWSGRMINIHPTLLPVFKGLNSHARALAAGVRIHGCTVHFVTEGMDEGPIIAQAAVEVLPNDTEEALATRVLEAEHRLYPEALQMVARGAVRLSAGRALFRSA